MTADELKQAFVEVCATALPLPGSGTTAERHMRLFEIAQQDVSLAKLAEAHWDAVAILAQAGRRAVPGVLYGVWASEIPHSPLRFANGKLSGEKAFCTGYGIVERALVTIGSDDGRLLDLDVRPGPGIHASTSPWHTEAFRFTNTGAVCFEGLEVDESAVVGEPYFYLNRPGFWQGACGPAACWAGGVSGLLTFAGDSRRADPHTLAHLAGMHANIWAMRSILQKAGDDIDAHPLDVPFAHELALTVRHLVEQLATDTLRRFARAYGPVPLLMQEHTARRYQEVDIFLRQCHGERDLQALGGVIRAKARNVA